MHKGIVLQICPKENGECCNHTWSHIRGRGNTLKLILPPFRT